MKTINHADIRSTGWRTQIFSDDWVLSYNEYKFELTEMPKKGQRKVKRFSVGAFGYHAANDLRSENVVIEMELEDSHTYEDVKGLIMFALYRSLDLYTVDYNTNLINYSISYNKPSWYHVSKGYEVLVSSKDMAPLDAQEFTIKGKDFSMKINWNDFSSYSPSSDLAAMDPSYSVYQSKTKASAHKMYKLAWDNKHIFSGLKWNELGGWLSSKRISHDLRHSCWH